VGEVTAATIATIPKITTPSTFRSISGFTLPSMHHNNSPLLQCPIFETSATALCGTTGILGKMVINQWRFGLWYPSFVEKTVLHDVFFQGMGGFQWVFSWDSQGFSIWRMAAMGMPRGGCHQTSLVQGGGARPSLPGISDFGWRNCGFL